MVKAFGIVPGIYTLLLAVLALAYAAMTKIIGMWSWWIAVPAGLAFGTFALNIYTAFKAAMAVRGIKKLDLPQVGKECVAFHADVMDFLVGRADAAPAHLPMRALQKDGAPLETAYADWSRTSAYTSQTRARVVQRFAHRASALSRLLEAIGVKPPTLWGFDQDAAGVAIYIGAVGELLEKGLLTEARLMNPEQQQRSHVHIG